MVNVDEAPPPMTRSFMSTHVNVVPSTPSKVARVTGGGAGPSTDDLAVAMAAKAVHLRARALTRIAAYIVKGGVTN